MVNAEVTNIFEWFQNSGTFSDDRRVYECYRFLTHSASILASSLDYDTTLTRLANLCVPYLADLCIVDIVEDDQSHRRLVAKHANADKQQLTQQLVHQGLDTTFPFGAAKVIQTGKPEFYPDIEFPEIVSLATRSRNLQIILELESCSLMAVPMLAHGKVLGVLTLIFGESRRRYNEKDLLVAQGLAQHAAMAVANCRVYKEMKKAVRARDEVLAMVSHDLKNPVCAIRLNSDLLKMVFLSESVESKRSIGIRATETILASSKRMHQLIEDLLDISVLESGKFQVAKERCEAQQLLKDAFQVLKPIALQKSISLVDQMNEPKAQIYCDRDRILQVLSNIIGNAIKFTPSHGTIRITFEQNEQEARFMITDNGLGIPQSDLPYIFDRYWHSKKSEKAGAGLGLAIAKGIITAHDGKIWAHSKENEGSSFCFTLPLNSSNSPLQKTYTE